MSGVMNSILECAAATQLGQFIIKKVDFLLWSLEKPARYSVHGENKNDTRNMPWPIFWTILINLQIFRVVCSTILVQFNKGPIESKEMVKNLQKWRRALRSIRFQGVRTMREKLYGTKSDNGKDVITCPPPKQSSKKRNHDEMQEYDLDDLMNRTFSDTDHTDSTFMVSKNGDLSTNGSSNGHSLSDDYQSPLKPKKDGYNSSLQDTLPISASESEQHEPNLSTQSTKSNESTFVSTVDDTEESAFVLTEEDSIDGFLQTERNGTSSTDSTVQSNGNSKIGKESLNAPIDPVDAMMSKLVEMDGDGKTNQKKTGKNHHKKKRNFSLTSQENLNRQNSMKVTKSQESINNL